MLEWDEKKGNAIDRKGNVIKSLKMYSYKMNIPYRTLQKYVCSSENRRVIGKQVGRASLLSRKDQRFVAEVCARKYRANDGAQLRDVVTYITKIDPGLLEKSARDHYHCTLKKKNADILKQDLVSTQASTSKWNQITPAQQYRWHTLVDSQLNVLRERNTGLCQCGCVKSFRELIDSFIIAADETCIMAGEKITLKFLGAKHKKKNI